MAAGGGPLAPLAASKGVACGPSTWWSAQAASGAGEMWLAGVTASGLSMSAPLCLLRNCTRNSNCTRNRNHDRKRATITCA